VVSLCRVVVDVVPVEGGWSVDVRAAGAARLVVPVFGVEAAELPDTSLEQHVPVVPEARRRPVAPLVDALCHGDVHEAAALIGRLADRDPDPGDVAVYGRWLFECLLAPAWQAITELQAVKDTSGVELALRWPAEEADLHRLVWEAMNDGTRPLVGSLGLLVAITRLVPEADGGSSFKQPDVITWLPRVLFASGSPLVEQVVRPGAMFMGLLRGFEAEGRCVSSAVQKASIDKLTDACARHRPDVVHLVAHGALRGGRGVLVLGDPAADADAAALIQAVRAGGRPLAVVLSACDTGTAGGPAGTAPLAAELVSKGNVPIVSAMAGEVSEQACRLYTRQFVAAIHDGESVVEASAKGRRAALGVSEDWADHLDWAMPTLFLAASLTPDFRPVIPDRGRELVQIAEGLALRSDPVFIGGQDIFDMVDDELFHREPTKRIGFIGIMEKDIAGLGGTRLLREIGFRLVRCGHLPLLLGPYEGKPPKSLRAVVAGIIEQALTALGLLGRQPIQFTVFGADPGFAVPPVGTSIIDLQDHVISFREIAEDLDPGRVRLRLANDLAALGRCAATAGEPFGDHTRVVLLADEVHDWVAGLDGILAILEKNRNPRIGLGTADYPVPLIVTASSSIEGGPKVKAFTNKPSAIGLRAPPLRALALSEAVLGFEWVLLHPWQKDADEEWRLVYTRARTADAAAIEKDFKQLGGIPTKVTRELYLVAGFLANHHEYVTGNDEKAWKTYVDKYG
jgi:hypothetical protein